MYLSTCREKVSQKGLKWLVFDFCIYSKVLGGVGKNSSPNITLVIYSTDYQHFSTYYSIYIVILQYTVYLFYRTDYQHFSIYSISSTDLVDYYLGHVCLFITYWYSISPTNLVELIAILFPIIIIMLNRIFYLIDYQAFKSSI